MPVKTPRVDFSPTRATQSSFLANSSPRGHLWSLATWAWTPQPTSFPITERQHKVAPSLQRPEGELLLVSSPPQARRANWCRSPSAPASSSSGDPPQGRTGISKWRCWLATLPGTLCTWVALGLTASGSSKVCQGVQQGTAPLPQRGGSLHQESLAFALGLVLCQPNQAPALREFIF